MQTRTTILNKPWLVLTAWGAFLVTVPSAIWRVLMITGLMPGTAELRAFELAGDPTLAYLYVFGLSIVQLSTGFLTVGLVRPWGERLLGHHVPLALPVIAGTLGGLAVSWLFTISLPYALASGIRPDAGLTSGLPMAVMVACYAPIVLWGPLVLASVWGYWRRRHATPAAQPAHRHPAPLR